MSCVDFDDLLLNVCAHIYNLQVRAHEEIQRLFTATFGATKTNPTPTTYHFLADSMRSRDIIVLTLRAIGKSDA